MTHADSCPHAAAPRATDSGIIKKARGINSPTGHRFGQPHFIHRLVKARIKFCSVNTHGVPKVQLRAARRRVVAFVFLDKHFFGNLHARADNRHVRTHNTFKGAVATDWVNGCHFLSGRQTVNCTGAKLKLQFIVCNLVLLVYGVLHTRLSVIFLALQKRGQHARNHVRCKLRVKISVKLLNLLDLRRYKRYAAPLLRPLQRHHMQNVGIAGFLSERINAFPFERFGGAFC